MKPPSAGGRPYAHSPVIRLLAGHPHVAVIQAGRCNTRKEGVATGVKCRASDRAGRDKLGSPGRPGAGLGEVRRQFWRSIASGQAAVDAGIPPAAGPDGSEWRGMPPTHLIPERRCYPGGAWRSRIAKRPPCRVRKGTSTRVSERRRSLAASVAPGGSVAADQWRRGGSRTSAETCLALARTPISHELGASDKSGRFNSAPRPTSCTISLSTVVQVMSHTGSPRDSTWGRMKRPPRAIASAAG